MQVNNKNNPEQPKKLKGVIARNQEIGDKINTDTLGSKIEASVKHSAETGLKTSTTVQKDIPPEQKHVTAQQLKNNHKNATHSNTENFIENNSPLISKDNADIKKNIQKINYVKNAKNVNIKKAINVKAKKSNKPDNIHSELQSKADLAKMAVQKKKKTEIKSKINRYNTAITKKVNRNTEITNSVKRKVISNRRKIKSTPNYINKNTKINYAKTLAMRKRQVKYVQNQKRKIKTAVRTQPNHTNLTKYNNTVLKATPKTIWTRYNSAIKNRIKRNETISRKQNKIIHSRNINGLKTGQVVRTPRLIKVRTIQVVGNLKTVRKIRLSKRIYKAIIGKLRSKLFNNSKFKKFLKKAAKTIRIMKVVSGYVKYGSKEIAAPALTVGKKIISLGVDTLNNSAKNVNYDDVSDTGVESLKFMYKNIADTVSTVNTTRHIATGVNKSIRTGIKATSSLAVAAPTTIRSIPGKVRQVTQTGRKIKTNAKRAARTTKHILDTFKKDGAKAAAKEAVKVTRKAAENAAKATIESFKLIVKAVQLIISNLPVIIIAVAVIIVSFLLIQGISALISAISGSISSTLNWAFPDYSMSEPGEVDLLIGEYDKALMDELQEQQTSVVDDAASNLVEHNDFYAVYTDYESSGCIYYQLNGEGTDIVREMVGKGVVIDKNEFYAILYVYLQKQRNKEDGDENYDTYEITFSESEIRGFIKKYFDIDVTKESGATCPNENCILEYCESEGCEGHYRCDDSHNKSTITFTKNEDIMSDLEFTAEEESRVTIVAQMFEDVILGEVLTQTEGVIE